MDGDDDRIDFCRREHGRLVGSLTLYTGDPDLAAELAQEALARACLHWPEVSRMAAPGAWVHRVAVNLAKSSFRRRAAERRARRRHGADPDHHDPSGPLAHGLAVRAAVTALPERQRAAVVLRYFADLPVADAAAAMGCAEGTVRALCSQALARLRPVLGPAADPDPTVSTDAGGATHVDRSPR